MEINAKRPEDIEAAYSLYYSRLAAAFRKIISPENPRLILEGGCGKGQLTLPLLATFPTWTRLIGVDSSKGPYSGWLDYVKVQTSKLGLSRRVNLVKADVRKMREIERESVDVIVSNELLCDLPHERELEQALKEFFRVLRPGGLMVHGEWSSFPESRANFFVLKHSPSWNPDQLFLLAKRAGCVDFQTIYFESTIRFSYRAAVEEVRSWGSSSHTIQHAGMIRKHGIQLPFEHVISCRKPILG